MTDIDIRFSAFRPTISDNSNEPSLYFILKKYYYNYGFGKAESDQLAKQYIQKWCDIEKVI